MRPLPEPIRPEDRVPDGHSSDAGLAGMETPEEEDLRRAELIFGDKKLAIKSWELHGSDADGESFVHIGTTGKIHAPPDATPSRWDDGKVSVFKDGEWATVEPVDMADAEAVFWPSTIDDLISSDGVISGLGPEPAVATTSSTDWAGLWASPGLTITADDLLKAKDEFEGVKQVNFRAPGALHNRLKVAAAKTNKKLGDLLTEMITRALDSSENSTEISKSDHVVISMTAMRTPTAQDLEETIKVLEALLTAKGWSVGPSQFEACTHLATHTPSGTVAFVGCTCPKPLSKFHGVEVHHDSKCPYYDPPF